MERPSGTGWQHRIDDVPNLRADVEIVTTAGKHSNAVTEANTSDSFRGIGCELRYAIVDAAGKRDGTTVLPQELSWWRYSIKGK